MLFFFRFFERCGRRFEVEVIWKWCDLGSYDECVGYSLGLEKREKKITLKWREQAIITLTMDELKLSPPSSLLSPPASPLRILQWVAMSTPTIILCVNTWTTYGCCQCRATFVPFQVSTTIQLKPPNINFGAGPSSCWLSYILPITQYLYRFRSESFVRFLLISFPPQSVHKFLTFLSYIRSKKFKTHIINKYW